MIRRYCDGCGEEIPSNYRLPGPHGLGFGSESALPHGRGFDAGKALDRIKVQVVVSVDGTWNGGQVCLDCVREVVADGYVYAVDEKPVDSEGAA